jgi:hypothetical protein
VVVVRTSYARGSRTGIQVLTLAALNMKGPIYMNLNDIYDTRYFRRSGVGYVIQPHAPFTDWMTMAGVKLTFGEVEVGVGGMLLIHHASGLYIPDTRNYQANVVVAGLRADSTNILRDSGILTLRGAYWDSASNASKDMDAQIVHRMLSTTPTSKLSFMFAGVEKAYLDSNGNLWIAGTLSVGDVEFRNGWRIVEDERYGLLLVSPSGRKYRFTLQEVVE